MKVIAIVLLAIVATVVQFSIAEAQSQAEMRRTMCEAFPQDCQQRPTQPEPDLAALLKGDNWCGDRAVVREAFDRAKRILEQVYGKRDYKLADAPSAYEVVNNGYVCGFDVQLMTPNDGRQHSALYGTMLFKYTVRNYNGKLTVETN